MHKSEYTGGLQHVYIPGSHKRKRKQNIELFNCPYSEHVKPNIGHEFLRLRTKHFPLFHCLRKICNKNNAKVSYSCMPNMASIISRHYKTLLVNRDECNYAIRSCNYKNKASCPLEGMYGQSSIVYKAATTSGGAARHYYGCSETEFKARFYNHNQSFKYRHKNNSIELSKAVWRAKDAGKDPSIKWSFVAHSAPYNLCLTERLCILQADSITTLIKRSKFNSTCRHTNKFKLKSLSQCRTSILN